MKAKSKSFEQLDVYAEQMPDESDAAVIEALRLSAARIEPTPDFVTRLSIRLRQQHRARGHAARRIPVRRLLWAGAAAALMVLLTLTLPHLFGSKDLPPLPRLAYAAAGEPAPAGLLAGATLTLSTRLPAAPAKVPAYVATAGAIPATSEDAIAWALRFGLSNPRVYHTPNDPQAIYVLGDDGQQLIFRQFGPMGSVDYSNDRAAADTQGPPPTLEQATQAAVAFLQEHGLLPEHYRAEDAENLQAEGSTRMIRIVPVLDGYPLVGYHSGAHVLVNSAGEVVYASLNPLTFERAHEYPVRSAEEAYRALSRGGESGSPFRLDVEQTTPTTGIRYYRPEPPAYTPGQAVTPTGWLQVLVAEEGDEVRAQLTARDGAVYDLSGPRVAELADPASTPGDVRVRGTIVARTGPHRWQVEVVDWDSLPVSNAQPPSLCRVGAFALEGPDAWLTTDAGERYRLPKPPAELADGERIEVCADEWPAGGEAVNWWTISAPPASEAQPAYVASSSTIVVVEAIEAPPLSPPPPTVHIVREGDTLASIAQQYGVTVDALLAANGITSADALAVGQALTIPEPSPLPAEPSRSATATPVPFEVGQQVEISGALYATIYVNGDARRVEAYLDDEADPEPPYLLVGPTELLEDIARHNRLHVRVWGEVVLAQDSPMGQAIRVERFERLWPQERIQGFLGHVDLETLEGREVAVFTDHGTGRRYVLDQSLEVEGYWASGQDPLLNFEQVFVTGAVHPERTYAGLPVLRLLSSQAGPETVAATSADQFPVETGPQVVDEAAMRPGVLQGAFTVERVELAYYYEPQPAQVVYSREGVPLNAPSPTKAIVQPVWVFYGRSPDGAIRFTAYVQAVAERYIEDAPATAGE